MKRWNDITPVQNIEVISELESLCNTNTTNSFKDFICKYNGGKLRPMPYIYDSTTHTGHTFSRVLSFNRDDEDNVFSVIESLGNVDFIPFGLSKNPNKFFVIQKNTVYCFDKSTNKLSKISGNFGNFTLSLQ